MSLNKIEISQKTIFAVLLSLLGVFVIYKLRELLVLVFISMLFASALNPMVTILHKRKIPRSFSIVLVYIVFIAVLATLVSLVLPPLVHESANLISRLNVVQQIPIKFDTTDLQGTFQNYSELLSNVGGTVPGFLGVVIGTFSGLLVVFTLFVMTYYLLVERANLHKYLLWLFGKTDAEQRATRFVDRVEKELGGWVRGELFLMFVIGLMTYIGLRVMGIPYAFPLAILAGLLEAVPNIGPTLSAVPAVLLAFFTISPATGFTVILLYVLIQQLENNIIVPKIMSSATNISPLIAIILIIAGVKLGGVSGAVLSLPAWILLRNIIREIRSDNNPFPHEAA